MKKKLFYQLLLLLLPAFSFSQEITGVWKGEFYVDSTKKYYPFELTISEDKGKFTGYSRISFEEKGIKQVVFRDHKIYVNADSIVIEDDNQLSKASSVSQPKEVKKVMVVVLTKMDSTMQLSGRWNTNKTRHYLAASGSITMQKKIDFKSTEIFKKLDSLSLTNKLSFNKPPVVEPPKEPEPIIIYKLILSSLGTAKSITTRTVERNTVTKPGFVLKRVDNLIAITKKEPVMAEVKEPVKVAVNPPVKKPATVVAAPVTKAPAPVVTQPAIVKAEPVKKPVEKKTMILPEQKNAAVDVSKRSVSGVQELFYKSDSLQLTLYDNGEIDGDTVSVLLNGKVIIAKKGLDTKPNSFTIYMDKETPDSQMLVMYAENLGTIPPNTGLLVVREGRSVYEVRFSADLKTNAAVVLRRRKDD